jgi:copper chaperone CopZ
MPAAFLIATVLLSPSAADALSQDKGDDKSTKLTFTLHGAHCKDCVDRMRLSLKKLAGVKFLDEDVKPAKEPRKLRPRFFSPQFEVTIADVEATNIGAFAAAVKKGGTPHEEDVETGVNLVLFPSKTIDEELIMDFRSALRDVNGLEVDANGGLGGDFKKGFVWIRLEDAGGAGLEEVLRAARSVDGEIRATKAK